VFIMTQNRRMPLPAVREKRMLRSTQRRAFFALALGVSPVIIWLGATLFTLQASAAAAPGPFDKLLGSWRGSGQVVGRNGSADKIVCRASYSPSADGGSLSQTLLCASDSYRFDIRSFFVSDAQGVEGHWDELTRSVTGHVSGKIVDGQFDGTITGTGFSAAISLRTAGHKQTVTISPQDGDIAHVNISMTRGGELSKASK
jgi:hypothetical protein